MLSEPEISLKITVTQILHLYLIEVFNSNLKLSFPRIAGELQKRIISINNYF